MSPRLSFAERWPGRDFFELAVLPTPTNAAFVELVERELADARVRAAATMRGRRVSSEDPGLSSSPGARPSRWRRGEVHPVWPGHRIIAALWLWAATHDGRAPTQREWLSEEDGHPSFNRVAAEFGGWATGVEAAGFERPVQGKHRVAVA